MTSLSNRSRDIKQILQNTRDIMDRLGLTEKRITNCEAKLQDQQNVLQRHADRIQAIETALRESAILKRGRPVVPATKAVEIAEDEGLSMHELYKLLSAAEIIEPGAHRTTQTHRIEGKPIRVVVIKEVRSR